MILDRSNMFDISASGSFTAITISRDSTDIIDLGISGQIGRARDIAPGTPIYVVILSNRLFAGGTSVAVNLQGAPDNGSGAEGTYTTYASSTAITTANLNAAPGLIFPITVPRPAFGAAPPRFLKLNYTVVGTYTAGGVMAGLALQRDDMVYYPSGFTTVGV